MLVQIWQKPFGQTLRPPPPEELRECPSRTPAVTLCPLPPEELRECPSRTPAVTLCPPPPEELREYFGAFGEIESVNVKTDPTTGRSRGFAFLVFSQPETVEKVSPPSVGAPRSGLPGYGGSAAQGGWCSGNGM